MVATALPSVQILNSDALTGLRSLPEKAAQAAFTSPPFYLLRRYGTVTKWSDGWEGELGHEAHPNEFVRHLLEVFDETWRVLKDDGVLWVNLADTYNNKQGKRGTTNASNGSNGRFAAGGRGYATALRAQPEFFKHYVPGIAHKSEMGVPFRFHLSMIDSEFRRFVGAPKGPQWICRRTVIWSKSFIRVEQQRAEGNSMPEPTLDRPSRNYEFLFMFAKKPSYYFDRKAIDVPSRASKVDGDRANAGSVWETHVEVAADSDAETTGVMQIIPEASPYRHVAMWPRALVRQMLLPSTREGDIVLDMFAGSGTTGEVAVTAGRKAILIESSDSCLAALEDRIGRVNVGLFPK